MDDKTVENILKDLIKLVDILQKQLTMHHQILKQLTGYKEEE